MAKELRSDIRAAMPVGKVASVYDPILDALPGVLGSERVRALALGKDDGKYAILVLATSRVILVRTTMFGRVGTEDLVLGSITSVEQRKKGLSSVLALHASGKNLELGFVDKKVSERFASKVRIAIDEVRCPTSSSAVPKSDASGTARSSEEIKQAIRDLGELRDEGLLTEEEFAAKKAALIAEM